MAATGQQIVGMQWKTYGRSQFMSLRVKCSKYQENPCQPVNATGKWVQINYANVGSSISYT